MAYNSLDPNNAWTEDSFWDSVVQFSEFQETPMSDSQLAALNERVRKYHEEDDDLPPPKPKNGGESEGSSSSGSTLAPNTPDDERNLGDSFAVAGKSSMLVVLDTPDRPGYVAPPLSPQSKNRSERRKKRLTGGSKHILCFDEADDDVLDDSVADLVKYHPHLAIKSTGQTSEAKK